MRLGSVVRWSSVQYSSVLDYLISPVHHSKAVYFVTDIVTVPVDGDNPTEGATK
jgi:hypothetical protein